MAYFLQEHPIIQEADVRSFTPGKAIFRMVIQTADDKNRNGRVYPRSVLDEAIKDCESMIRGRSFVGELDHPLITSDNAFNEQRQTTVLLKEASHIIRDYDWQGNSLIGEFETLSTIHGQQVLGLVRDKVSIGTSMRGLAELERTSQGNIVKGPLTIISYDIVSRPSHKQAVVDEKQVRFEHIELLKENYDICIGDKCYLKNHFDKLVETQTIKFFNRWI